MEEMVLNANHSNTTKTDLSLLLKSLKYQMKCPELQKQALLTIHTICEKRAENVDLLREMGGVAFMYNLSKFSIVHSDVKETFLFVLGALAEANVSCKNLLSRKETFVDLGGCLMNEDTPLTMKRVSVYLLTALVANNKVGQTLAQTTGCLDILLAIFRSISPLSTEATMRIDNTTQTYQLWVSVSSALCGCVNNPQNEEGQRICMEAFPTINIWLQRISLSSCEMFQPICSFIAMAVANNSFVQENFHASGGLEILTRALVGLSTRANSLLSCQLSLTIAKTLSACITDNAILASDLSHYGVVVYLLSLLSSSSLDYEDRLTVLLTIGHCTHASEAHQSQLVQCGGLPLIIMLLTEDTNEEVRKAATFILQSCKQATMSLGVSGLRARNEEFEDVLPNIESFKSSAREFLHRIYQVDKRQAKTEDGQEDLHPLPGQPSLSQDVSSNVKQESCFKQKEICCKTCIELQTANCVSEGVNISQLDNASSVFNSLRENAYISRWNVYSQGNAAGYQGVSSVHSLDGGRDCHLANSQLFKTPEYQWKCVKKEINDTEEGKFQHSEASKVIQSCDRCAGCVSHFEEVTSRTFTSLLLCCNQICDMHTVLQEASDRFRGCNCHHLLQKVYSGKTVEQADQNHATEPTADLQRNWESLKGFGLTPICKRSGQVKHGRAEHGWLTGMTLTPLCNRAKSQTFTSSYVTAVALDDLRFVGLSLLHCCAESQ